MLKTIENMRVANDSVKDKTPSIVMRPEEIMTREELAFFGIYDCAYVKKEITNAGVLWVVYAAEGTKLTETKSKASAMLTVKQNDMKPVNIN